VKVIYASAYYRGLEVLLNMWPAIRKECPKAELNIFYGWGSWDALEGANGVELKKNIIGKLEALKDQGVTEHGRISHKQLAKEFNKADVFAYPTEFPEIHCITALKAQEASCYPVVTNVGALQETVQCGDKIEGKNIYSNQYSQSKFIKAVVSALKEKKKGTPVPNCDWQDVATKWEELIK
jgi:glycosyltransferase involved in cell wall biosynthesis